MMKYFILLCALFACQMPLSVAGVQPASPQYKIDSLQSLLSSLEKGKKLNALQKIIDYTEDQYIGMQAETEAIASFLAEARKQKNMRAEAAGMARLLICYHNYNENEQLLAEAPRILRFLLDNNQMKQYWSCSQIEIETMLYADRTEDALDRAEEMYNLAKQKNDPYGMGLSLFLVGKAYQVDSHTRETIRALEDALTAARKVEKPGERMDLLYMCSCDLAYEYTNKGEPEKAVEVLTRWSRALDADRERELRDNGWTHNNDMGRFYCDLYLSEAYTTLREFAKADTCLQRAAVYAADKRAITRNNLHVRQYIYYMEKGDYASALSLAEQCLAYFRETESLYDVIGTTTAIRKIKIAQGHYRDACKLGDEILSLSDSLQNETHLRQLGNLRTVYEVDKLTAEKERQRLLALSAGACSLLLLVILALYIRYTLRLKAKNHALYEQIQENLRRTGESRKAMESIPEQTLSREMRLFRALERLMEAERLFTAPDLDRKALADRLATNERYLADAIREGAGLTVAAYISRLRLEYAVRLMESQPQYTTHAIAADAGFTSYDPFLKAFTRMYGMTPFDYRKLAKAK